VKRGDCTLTFRDDWNYCWKKQVTNDTFSCLSNDRFYMTDATTNCRTVRTMHNNQVSARRWRRAPPCCFFSRFQPISRITFTVALPRLETSPLFVAKERLPVLCVAWKWDRSTTETEFNRNYLTVNRTLWSVIKASLHLSLQVTNRCASPHLWPWVDSYSSPLLRFVNLILFTLLLVHLILRTAPHHHLSLPRPFTQTENSSVLQILSSIVFSVPFGLLSRIVSK